MKLVLLITDYGSFNNFLGELAVNMASEGHEIHVISSNVKVIKQKDKFDYEALGIKIHWVNFPRGFNFYLHYKASVHIHNIIDSINPDLVHLHFTTGIFTTVFTKRLKYFTLGTFHGLGYTVVSGYKKFIFKSVETFCFNRIDQIVLLNKFDYDIVSKKYPAKTVMYKSLGVGCDMQKFNPAKFDDNLKQKLRSELNIGAGDFIISFTGRYVNFKGYHLAVKSFLALHHNHKNIRLVLMGGKDVIHPTGLTAEEEELMNNCKNIINIGFTSEIEKYLAISDVFLFPSVKEGMPVCIIEALAMQVPVITTNSRGCNDLVIDDFNGYLVDNPPTVDQIVLKIQKLLTDRAKLREFSENTVVNKKLYDRMNYVEEQYGVYKSLLNNSNK